MGILLFLALGTDQGTGLTMKFPARLAMIQAIEQPLFLPGDPARSADGNGPCRSSRS